MSIHNANFSIHNSNISIENSNIFIQNSHFIFKPNSSIYIYQSNNKTLAINLSQQLATQTPKSEKSTSEDPTVLLQEDSVLEALLTPNPIEYSSTYNKSYV